MKRIFIKIPIRDTIGLLGLEQGMMGRYRCPFKKHRTEFSLGVNEEKNVWYCHSCCVGGSPVRLAARAWRCKMSDALPRLMKELNLDPIPTPQGLAARIEKLENCTSAIQDPSMMIAHAWVEAGRIVQASPPHRFRFDPDPLFVTLRKAVADAPWEGPGKALQRAQEALDGVRRAVGTPLPGTGLKSRYTHSDLQFTLISKPGRDALVALAEKRRNKRAR